MATSPTTKNILRGPDGKPGLGKRSCQSRWCTTCGRARASRVADELTAVAAGLLVDDSVSDGTLRMLTLTAPDPAGGVLADQLRLLWWAWSELRKEHKAMLRNCFASLELTYNPARDSYHPHLHVMVIARGYLDRGALLRSWQYALGVKVGGPLGGVDVRQMDGIKEAIKYPLKGMGRVLGEMNEKRALEIMRTLQGKRTLRTYGAFRSVVQEVVDEETEPDVDDTLLTDPETGEVWAPTMRLAEAAGCGKLVWSWSAWQVECARECLFALHDAPKTAADVERQQRKGRRRRNKIALRKWSAKRHRIRRIAMERYSTPRPAKKAPRELLSGCNRRFAKP